MKLFGTDGVRGKANAYPITAEIALRLGKAAALVLRKRKSKPVFLIGKDTRLSGYMLECALTSGLTSMGADVYLVGPMPTPAIAHLTRSFAADAGIMISASHNPSTDNGIKFFDNNGFKLPDDVEEKIEKLVLGEEIKTDHIDSRKIGRVYRIEDAQGRYIEFVKASIRNTSLKGLKVVLDCANGAAYKVAPLIFRELGAELITICNRPDGNNINEECGALHPEVLRAAVLGNQADVGITLDGDADRILMVDEQGNVLDGDHILAIAAIDMLEKNKLKENTVVVTGYTNLAFDRLIESKGGNTVRVRNGDRYVIEEMKKGYNLGGEFSGHIIFSDYNSTGDGVLAGLQILKVMKDNSKKLSTLAKALKKYPQVIKSIRVTEKIPLKELASVMEEVRKAEAALGDSGRHLIRYSGTEMKARVMLEGPDEDDLEKYADNIARAIKKEVG